MCQQLSGGCRICLSRGGVSHLYYPGLDKRKGKCFLRGRLLLKKEGNTPVLLLFPPAPGW